MKILTDKKIRLEQMETFFDIFPSTSYGFELIFYLGLSFLALIQFDKEKEIHLMLFPDEEWFKEWLEQQESKLKIIFQQGKK